MSNTDQDRAVAELSTATGGADLAIQEADNEVLVVRWGVHPEDEALVLPDGSVDVKRPHTDPGDDQLYDWASRYNRRLELGH